MAFFKKYKNSVTVRSFDWNEPVKITPEMAELLGLTKAEQDAAEGHLRQAADAMTKLDDANTVVTKQTANSFNLEIPPDPQGKALAQQLQDELAGDLGADRSDFLLNEQNAGYSDPFHGFADGKIEWQVSWDNENGSMTYHWKEIGYGPDGMEKGSSWSSGSSLPAALQRFVAPDAAH